MNESARIALLMVVSPGEERLALASLQAARQAAERGGFALSVQLVDNRPVDAAPLFLEGLVVLPVVGGPRPYFEIARTIFGALQRIDAEAFEWVIKIDPDTLVLDPEFFGDVIAAGANHRADLIACLTRGATWGSHLKLVSRLFGDLLPIAPMRRPGDNRYGRATHWRKESTWHARILRKVAFTCRILRRYPSGGFYALSGRLLDRLQTGNWLSAKGANGLEWNDDTLLPLAVRAAGGAVLNLRDTKVAPHWRWMHGSRYFTPQDAAVPGLRAVHPLKNNDEDWRIRQQLGFPAPLEMPAQST